MNERVISSVSHPVVKHLLSLRDDAAYREINNSIMVQGSKMIREVGQQQELRLLLVAEPSLVPRDIRAAEVIIGNEMILQKVSGVVNSEGIVAEIERPLWSNFEGATKILALDGVSDPGNVGTLLRTALALGWHGVYFLEGCCDPYNDKALRAAMGATFRIPVARGNWAQLQKIVVEHHLLPIVADISGTPVDQTYWNTGILLVLGNEAKGPSDFAKRFCSAVTIPMSGSMESLNVGIAGAILMYILGKNDHIVGAS